jgi:hypothetical protein
VIMSSTFRYLLTLKVILNLGNRNMKGKVQWIGELWECR